MKLYICENINTAKWRKNIINKKKLSAAFAKKCICDFIGEKERGIKIVFAKNEYGKPYVSGIYKTTKIKMDISLYFSVSHSGNMIICAVACFNIGADCQKPAGDFETCKKITKRYFSENENIFLSNFDSREYIDNFFKVWTKKEAYIKYTGKGFFEGLATFSVTTKTKQKNYCGEAYFKKININSEKICFYIYLCYNKTNKNAWEIKYFK